ncbi:MAG: hypothetical protein ACI8X5_003750 [Planctomycetota bacterium]
MGFEDVRQRRREGVQKSQVKIAILVAGIGLSVPLSYAVWKYVQSSRSMVAVLDNSVEVESLINRESTEATELVALNAERLVARKPWTPELARRIFPMLRMERAFTYDDVLGCRRTSNFGMKQIFEEHPNGHFMISTNALGFSDDDLAESADIRILFAGDSQTEGVCGIRESFVNLLEVRLQARHPEASVEAVNAAMGGSNPWRYLSTLEAYSDLKPDFFAPVFYGGNDFREVMSLERLYRKRGLWNRHDVEAFTESLSKLPAGMGPVELRQLQYFSDNPGDEQIAVDVWVSLAMEMSRLCESLDIEFFPIYLPPPLAGQPEPYAPDKLAVSTHLPGLASSIDRTHLLADRFIAKLQRGGIEVLDLRPALRASQERLFWESGYHLNLKGQVHVARALDEAFSAAVASLLEGPSSRR